MFVARSGPTAPRHARVGVDEFDRYQGKGVPDGMVSLSVRLTFRDRDRTLTDADVQRSVDAIVAALAGTHGAVAARQADRSLGIERGFSEWHEQALRWMCSRSIGWKKKSNSWWA